MSSLSLYSVSVRVVGKDRWSFNSTHHDKVYTSKVVSSSFHNALSIGQTLAVDKAKQDTDSRVVVIDTSNTTQSVIKSIRLFFEVAEVVECKMETPDVNVDPTLTTIKVSA